MNLNSKVILGTANFGSNYGLSNTKINRDEIKKILELAKKYKIDSIDTAYNYKNAEKLLGNFNLKNFKIITKIPKIPINKDPGNWIKNKLYKSLERLKLNKIHALFLHNELDILSENKREKIMETFNNLKSQKIINKIGCSIYNVPSLNQLLRFYKFDIIQAPFNIFDRRISKKKNIKLLEKHQTKLHLRSIFLQGILVNPKIKLPKKLVRFEKNINDFKNWCKLNNISFLEGCISVLKKFNFDKILIGFENHKQLKKIILSLNTKKIIYPEVNFSNKNLLIDPRKWF